MLDAASSGRLLGTVTRADLQAVFDRRSVPDPLLARVDQWLEQSDAAREAEEAQRAARWSNRMDSARSLSTGIGLAVSAVVAAGVEAG